MTPAPERPHARHPLGIAALAAFFMFGCMMAFLACLSLAMPGSALEPMWRINPEARHDLGLMETWAVVLMAVVGLACGAAAVGLWKRARWGQRFAVGLLAVNLIGDALSALVRHDARTLIGLPIGGALLAYLLSARVRGTFSEPRRDGPPSS